MKMVLSGFLFVVYYELMRTIKSALASYVWFVVLIFLSTYGFFFGEYSDTQIGISPSHLTYGSSPMADIMIFFSSFFTSSVSGAVSGKTPEFVIPETIGTNFFIIFTLFIGLTMIAKFTTEKASVSISGEKEKKTIYILASSPVSRNIIYYGKFIAICILALPIIIFLYTSTNIVFLYLFPSQINVSDSVLKVSIITTFLFSSVGLLVSVLWEREKTALWSGTRIVASMIAFTTMWFFIPLAETLPYFRDIKYLPLLDSITHISPFTMNLMAVYDSTFLFDYLIIQGIVTVLFLAIGVIIFIKQDLEC